VRSSLTFFVPFWYGVRAALHDVLIAAHVVHGDDVTVVEYRVSSRSFAVDPAGEYVHEDRYVIVYTAATPRPQNTPSRLPEFRKPRNRNGPSAKPSTAAPAFNWFISVTLGQRLMGHSSCGIASLLNGQRRREIVQRHRRNDR
jgi:hypothetical protein